MYTVVNIVYMYINLGNACGFKVIGNLRKKYNTLNDAEKKLQEESVSDDLICDVSSIASNRCSNSGQMSVQFIQVPVETSALSTHAMSDRYLF